MDDEEAQVTLVSLQLKAAIAPILYREKKQIFAKALLISILQIFASMQVSREVFKDTLQLLLHEYDDYLEHANNMRIHIKNTQ